MDPKFIRFFIRRHLLTNLVLISVLLGGVLAWQQLPKEEMPDVTMDRVRVSVAYPGASAEEVEYHVTRPMEEALADLDGVYRVTSATSTGSSQVTVELEKDLKEKQEVISEIRNEVLDVDLPEDITVEPEVRVFKTSRRPIIDVAFFFKEKIILDVVSRQQLQEYALAMEHQLLALPEVSRVNRSGYLQEEIQIRVDPKMLREYDIPFNTVMREVRAGNIRQPAGNIENEFESKVTVLGELDEVQTLKQFGVQGGFEGNIVRLSQIADVGNGFEKNKSIYKINGREGVFLNVVKSSGSGILDAVTAVQRRVKSFQADTLAGTPVEAVLLDDESVDVKNRLSLIGTNGLLGFALVLLCLFLFLDARAAIWVAVGIPFTFCFSLIGALWLGYSANNITLAAIIIVMGMVVDDAIVVSENINRLRGQGLSLEEAAEQGTAFVFLPVIASILTTCVAFIPLMFFSGRFAIMAKFIPPIVFLMLAGSLLEALLILPGHMALPFDRIKNFLKLPPAALEPKRHWFSSWEDKYERLIRRLLKNKGKVFLGFALFLLLSVIIGTSQMRFVMFPNEETRNINISGRIPSAASRYQTARLAQPLEEILHSYVGKEVIGFRNIIARGRHGQADEENLFRMRVEIVPPEKRNKSAAKLIAEFEKKFTAVPGVSELKFSRSWHGQDGDSPIKLQVRANNDATRDRLCEAMAEEFRKHPALVNVEIDRPLRNPEYRLSLNRDKVRRLGINPEDIAATLRAALEGRILYEFGAAEETVQVRLTIREEDKKDLAAVLSIPVENQGQYLVPLQDLVTVEEAAAPESIIREEGKRTTTVFADLKPGSGKTPLEIADYFEQNVFGRYLRENPSAMLEFGGEIKDSRESGQDFQQAVIMVLILIYMILALLFNSLMKPFVIMLAIPFGIVGVILAFWLHGINQYGFFALIGLIGLSGVVINDAIIMVVKLDRELNGSGAGGDMDEKIAAVSKTRLRAVLLTTITTVVAIIPTAYGWAGYDSMLTQMMLALGWGLFFGTAITLVLIPCLYSLLKTKNRFKSQVPIGAGLLLVLGLIAPGTVQAKAEPVLSLQEFIVLASGRDTVFEQILIDKLALKYARDLRLPAGDIVFQATAQHSLIMDPDDEATEAKVSLSKLFPRQGTEISAAYSAALTGSDVGSDLTLLISQPIAENAFGRSTRLLDKIVGYEVQVAEFQIVEAYEDYLALLIQSYYDWYEAWEQLQVARSLYEKNMELLENIKARQRNSIALPVDVNKIMLQVLANEENLVSLNNAYAGYLNLIKQAVRWERGVEPVPTEPGLYRRIETDFSDYLKARNETRTAVILRLLLEKSGIEARRARDELLPSTRLFAGLSLDGDKYDLEEEDKKAFAGISFEFPFAGTLERANYQVQEIEQRKAGLARENTLISLDTQLENLYCELERERKLIEIAEKKIELAREIVEAETVNYSYGKTDLNDLIDEINKLEENRFSRILHEVRLRRLNIEWLRLTDRLVGADEVLDVRQGGSD